MQDYFFVWSSLVLILAYPPRGASNLTLIVILSRKTCQFYRNLTLNVGKSFTITEWARRTRMGALQNPCKHMPSLSLGLGGRSHGMQKIWLTLWDHSLASDATAALWGHYSKLAHACWRLCPKTLQHCTGTHESMLDWTWVMFLHAYTRSNVASPCACDPWLRHTQNKMAQTNREWLLHLLAPHHQPIVVTFIVCCYSWLACLFWRACMNCQQSLLQAASRHCDCSISLINFIYTCCAQDMLNTLGVTCGSLYIQNYYTL